MNYEELKRLWQCQKLVAPANPSPADQIKFMRLKMKLMDRAFLWVDAMIIVIGAACILLFAWHFLHIRPVMARIGLVITIAGLAYDIWEPIRARRLSPQPPADAPVTQWLRHEIEKIRAQSGLKRSKLWSVLPLWIGSMVLTWGLDIDLSARIFFSAFLTGLNLIIYVTMAKLNQYTWRKADLPLIEELESLLKSHTPSTDE
jgi:hypothetical protein